MDNRRSLGVWSVVVLGVLAVLLLSVPPGRLGAQQITGRVLAAQTGIPLSAVQVYIADLDVGVLSQADGRYALLNLPAGTHTLTAARIGYRAVTVEVTVGVAQTVIRDFSLSEEAISLDEVIVTGTAGGTQRRALGNDVGLLDASAVAPMAPVVNVEQLLGERLAGVMVMPSSGTVGSDAAPIRIRGSSSPGLTNDPIIYIDGIRMNSDRPYTSVKGGTSRLNDINPADIESIQVIKGPAAATLYGTEASNGVIQIITKRGVAGAPAFDVSAEFGSSWLAKPAEKLGDHWAASPITGEIIHYNLYEAEEARFGTPVFGNGPLQNYNVSVRGGSDLIRYFASLNQSNRDGIVSWNWDNRTSARVNLGVAASEALNIDISMSANSGETSFDGDIWDSMYSGSPQTAGDYGGREDRRRGYRNNPPEALRDYREDTRTVDRRMVSLELNFIPWDWFRHRVVGGVDITHDEREVFTKQDTEFEWFGSSSQDGSKSVSTGQTNLTSLDYSATAGLRLMDDRLGSMTSVGLQYYAREVHSLSLSGQGLATPSLSTIGAAAVTSASENLVSNNTVGMYVQEQLDWNDRMFLTGAVRFDDNSAFGADYDAAVYPKLSAAWVVSEESFWNLGLVNQLRLRGAWGTTGQQPDVFAATRLYEAQPGPGDVSILTPSAYGNADLAPERGEELELGFDASFFDDRATLTFTHYWKTLKDAIVEQPTAESLGFPSNQFLNIGEVKNWGTETELDLLVLTEDPVRWNLLLGFATMNNKITDLGGLSEIPVRRGRLHVEGYSLASVMSQKVVSAEFVSGNSGPVTNIMCDGGTGSSGREIGGTPVPCEEAPYVFFGKGEPTWQASVSSVLNLFTNWRLLATVDGRGGHLQYNDALGANHTTFLNTQCQAYQDDLLCMAARTVNRAPLGFHDGGFARLRELALNYSVPDGWAGRLGFDQASINFAWRNVALLWFPGKYAGEYAGSIYPQRMSDPEMGIGSENFGGEIERVMPPLSQASVTVRFSF